ncbi:peptide ABC transporter permease [Scytonema hofmannii PCC 7110]|uniref:Peptide ABC transporter permease n=2 Tax=Scytonema hofmannii TaxID=34078 RepID=A0A139WXY1_9CYAN|nr:peptide ABC transporter permease [Scytonema hofmannii PCC 7110]
MTQGVTLEATAEYNYTFLQVRDEAENQPKLDLTLEPDDPLAQTPNSIPTPEAPLRENSFQKAEPLPKQCSLDNSSSTEKKIITFGNIKIAGSTIFQEDDLRPILEAFQEREPTREELSIIADSITLIYLNKGYINSRAVINLKTVDGKPEILVTEGRIGQIEIYGLRRINLSYVCSRISLGANVPLDTNELENQLRLLRADPLFENIEASLRAEKKEGVSTLVVRVKEANPFVSSLSVDNYFPPVVGSERFGTELRYRNLTGIGDEIAASYYRSFSGGAEVWDFIYRAPLNPKNGTLQLRAAPSNTSIIQEPFDRFGVRETQELYEISYRQPLIRSLNEELALSLSFTYQDGQTFILDNIPVPFLQGPNESGVTRTSVIKFSQDYTRRDFSGAWSLRSQFSLGTGWFGATVNESPIPDSRFFSWLGQVQRVQRLDNNHLLLMQADLQLTPNTLLTSQQFIIGGGQSLRGYRENLRTGDNGFRFSIEDRIAILRNKSGYPVLQIAPYVDLGGVWNNAKNPNRIRNESLLLNTGLGVLWDKPLGIHGLTLRLDYSIPIYSIKDRGDNIQDTAFYFSARYQI